MRRFALTLGLAVAVSGFAFSAANALPFLSCAVGTSVGNHARIVLKHKTIASCAGAMGCKCVSCYDLSGGVSSACYPLVIAMPK